MIQYHFFYNKILPDINNEVTLVIASEDFTFPLGIGDLRRNFYKDKQDLVTNLINHKFIKKIWVENLDLLHPKLTPLPLGILHYENRISILNSIKFKKINFNERKNNLFVCHRIRSHLQFQKRRLVSNFCQNKWKDFVCLKNNLEYTDFINHLLNSKFVLCVNGGGYDPSPKCWEALLCGCIPIIEHSTLNEAYKELPIIFIKKWKRNTITEDKLNIWLKEKRIFFENETKREEVLKKLHLNYWWNKINN